MSQSSGLPQRPPNSHEVARRAGVSRATVSHVFNGRTDGHTVPEATRLRVLQAAEEMGYRPNRTARALKTGKMNTVALWAALLTTPYYAQMLRHLQRQIEADGFEIVVTGSRKTEPFDLNHWPVDGILAIDKLRELNAFLDQHPIRPPVVSMGAYYSPRVDHVAVDLYGGAWAALEHLTVTGRKRIAFLIEERAHVFSASAREAAASEGRPSSPLRDLIGTGIDPRLAAYLDFMQELGQKPEFLMATQRGRFGAYQAVLHHMTNTLSFNRPDALLCRDDDAAIGALRGLREAGVPVPESVAVIGCDGIEDGEYQTPSLTTIVQPVAEACEAGWNLLRRRIADPSAPPQQVLLPARLEIRGSG